MESPLNQSFIMLFTDEMMCEGISGTVVLGTGTELSTFFLETVKWLAECLGQHQQPIGAYGIMDGWILTPLKTYMEPENDSFQEKSPFSRGPFSSSRLVFGGVHRLLIFMVNLSVGLFVRVEKHL